MERLQTAALSLAMLATASVVAAAPESAGQVIVRFKSGVTSFDQDRALGLAGARVQGRFALPSVPGARRTIASPALVLVTTTLPIDQAVAQLSANPAVAYAEPNSPIHAATVPDDPDYAAGRLWGLYSDDAPQPVGPSGTTASIGSGAEKAWASGNVGDRSVIVAVIDEGVAVDHPDLAANTWTNPFDPPNGIDDDANGFIDDTRGWDFLNGDASVYDGGASGSEDRHGTHVAGTIGAVGDDGLGVTGVCQQVTILPCKILGPTGGTTLEGARALDYLVDLKRRHGLRIVAANCSWTSTTYSRTLHDACIRAAREGILVVCASGNDAVDVDSARTYPATLDTTVGTITQPAASYDGVISVASLDCSGALSSFSNFGALGVDLAAPGALVYSSLPPSGHGYMSGTSMAAPHVAGAVGLWASAHPEASALDIRSEILATALPTASASGRTATGGRLDASSFVGPIVDAAVRRVEAPTLLLAGSAVMVGVTASNDGERDATFRVAFSDQAPPGGRAGMVAAPRLVTLGPGESRLVTFSWRTKGASDGTHRLVASVVPLTGEVDVADNVAMDTCLVRAPLIQRVSLR